MELTTLLNGARSILTWIATKLDAERRGKCQLSFALLFSFIRALFCQKKYFKFSLQVLAGHMEQSLNGRRFSNSAWNIAKRDAACKSRR
jgi:hypothetical protein